MHGNQAKMELEPSCPVWATRNKWRWLEMPWKRKSSMQKGIQDGWFSLTLSTLQMDLEHTGAQLVETLHYMPEGRGFNSRWCHWSFSLTLLLGLKFGQASTQPLREMSTRTISLCGGIRRPVFRAGNLTTFTCHFSWNLRASNWKPQGPARFV